MTELPRSSEETTYTAADRWQYLIALGLALFALALGRILQPSPQGFGTHEQLGLPPCFFFKFTGIPCPHCGLTTSIAHAARFDFLQAAITQPFGLILFALAVISIPLLIYCIKARVPGRRAAAWVWSKRIGHMLAACYLLAWIYKIAVMRGG